MWMELMQKLWLSEDIRDFIREAGIILTLFGISIWSLSWNEPIVLVLVIVALALNALRLSLT